ncbi:MAG: DNA-binding protein, partial [Bacillota bacterium]
MNWDDLPLKLTVPQAAEALGISPKTVYRLA